MSGFKRSVAAVLLLFPSYLGSTQSLSQHEIEQAAKDHLPKAILELR
jgi:hypothetical protein